MQSGDLAQTSCALVARRAIEPASKRRIIANDQEGCLPPNKLHILLVEDNPGDVYLITHALNLGVIPKEVTVVGDGEAALGYLRRRRLFRAARRPDLVVLDLNLPRVDGRQVLAELKTDPDLMTIPVVILSTSSAPEDISGAYERRANCFLTKPLDLVEYVDLVQAIEDYWLGCVALPA
jgi:chemotaxis family two-component system response regulator Rcp1